VIKTILTDIVSPLPVVLLGILILLSEISAGSLPPVSGVALLHMEMAQYEAVGVDMMLDGNKEQP
jgi:hypothetical protein